jgi:hypothetical protein
MGCFANECVKSVEHCLLQSKIQAMVCSCFDGEEEEDNDDRDDGDHSDDGGDGNDDADSDDGDSDDGGDLNEKHPPWTWYLNSR